MPGDTDTLEEQVLAIVEEGGLRLSELTERIAANTPAPDRRDMATQTKREALRLIDEGRLRVDYDYKLHVVAGA